MAPFSLIMLLIAGIYLFFLNSERLDCEKSGGKYMRGLYHMECINTKSKDQQS